jgi:hypothetical protein
MRSLLTLDKAQLDRIDTAIAALQCRSPAERQKRTYLLLALESERQELMQCNPAIRRAVQLKAA